MPRWLYAILLVPARVVHAFRRSGTVARLARDSRRGRTAELWFGDSHAMYFNGPVTTASLWRADRDQTVCHLGPRLMFSVARNGFPPRATRTARLVRRVADGDQVLPVVVTGEIDVRCHLSAHTGPDGSHDLGFVATYVERGCELAALMGASRVVLVVPPPPSIDAPVLPGYPVVGSIDERISTFLALRSALGAAVSSHDGPVRAELFDATTVLSDTRGGLRAELTDDGIHTNAAGVTVVRDHFARFVDGLAPATGERSTPQT